MVDRVNESRMLVRLGSEIASAKDALTVNCKRAERASYLARLGKFLQARSELESLRAAYQSTPNAVMSSWLNLLEGLIGHFSNMDSGARGKIQRAHALSSAAGLPRIRGLSAAWLAHMDYLQVDPSSMTRHIVEAFEFSDVNEHSTRARASLILAQAYHFAGKMDLALPWYERSRSHAVSEGDDATVSALMHNMAWLKAQRLRAADCDLASDLTAVESHALLGAESTANFDALIGSTSLRALVPILRAQILIVQGQYEEALKIFDAEMSSAIREGMGRLTADLLADQAWCRFHCGQVEAAFEDAMLAQANININGHFDDRAIAYSRISQTFLALGELTMATTNRSLSITAWYQHTQLQARILEELTKFEQWISTRSE